MSKITTSGLSSLSLTIASSPFNAVETRKPRVSKKDFTKLQEYIFAALIAKSNIDFIALDKGEITEDEVVKELIATMEAYTHGGLTLIKEKLEDNSGYFLNHYPY